MVYYPFPIAFGLAYLYYKPMHFDLHNKKLFNMCNVGEQYMLGKRRNEVLRQCNEILDSEDF